MYNFADIKTVHVEVTGKCNAACPMCSRYKLDGTLQDELVESHLTKDIFYKCFNDAFVKQVEHVYFSGVYGDPCMHPELIEFCTHLLANGISVSIDTNAGYRNSDFWKSLAELGVYVNFAVDGLSDTNHIYRKNVQWQVVENSLKSFSKSYGRGCWNFIVFEHNEHQVDRARDLAKELGLDFRLKVTQKFRRFKNWNAIEYFLNPPKSLKYRHSNIGKDEFTTELVKQDYSYLDDVEIDCKALSRNEIFLSFEGYVLPCCYLGTLYSDRNESQQIKTLGLERFSLTNYDLTEVIDHLEVIKESWSKKINDGKLVTCGLTCRSNTEQHTKYVRE